MGYEPRRLEKFEDSTGSYSYIFPLADWEQESSQGLRNAYTTLFGASYAFDHLGDAQAPKEVGSETLRVTVLAESPTAVDEEVSDMLSVCWRIGRGKLYTIDSAGLRYWAWARLGQVPTVTWKAGDAFQKGANLEFVRLSDWHATTQEVVTQTITVSGSTITVENPGTLPAYEVVVQLKANTSGGITNPKLTNQTNGVEFETARDSASANSEIKLDTSRPAVEYSNDNGGSYTDDFANYVLPPNSQPVLSFRLEAGENVIEVTCGGTPNLDVVITYWPVYG